MNRTARKKEKTRTVISASVMVKPRVFFPPRGTERVKSYPPLPDSIETRRSIVTLRKPPPSARP